MLSYRFVLASLLISTALGRVVVAPHEKRDAPPEAFKAVSPASSDETIELRFALAPKDFAGLEKALYAASTPGSSAYGQYLTKSEVEGYVGPSQETVDSVYSWLSTNGLTATPLSSAGDWISVNMTVSQANKLLEADFTVFEDTQSTESEKIIRTLSYSLPAEVKDSILTVHPTISFPVSYEQSSPKLLTSPNRGSLDSSKSKREPTAVPTSCLPDPNDNRSWINPYTVRCRFDYYGLSKDVTAQSDDNSLWLSGFGNDFVNKKLLNSYMSKFRPDITKNVTFDLVTIDGGLNNQLPPRLVPFATTMMQVIASTTTNVPLTFMSVGTENSDDFMDWFLDQANYLLALDDQHLPKVVVHGDPVPERIVPRALATKLCDAYAQLTARGVSLIHGVLLGGVDPIIKGDEPTENCSDFDVSFPASCPYVTSVGGTDLDVYKLLGKEVVEIGAFLDQSSGGWSNYFGRPAYQDTVVSSYLQNLGDAYNGRYNASGRAIPDISAFYLMELSTGGALYDPSYSAGLFASMIAMINDELLAAGKSPLGFLNPWIYQNADAFHDITLGRNPGCDTNGFNASTGWDPVTGLGSPLFARLRTAAGLS
jgi:tripeptidyl-peptidase-1